MTKQDYNIKSGHKLKINIGIQLISLLRQSSKNQVILLLDTLINLELLTSWILEAIVYFLLK